ncbi:hypothetical protein [Metabacillus malikii]|uniref:DNA-binding transcriptional MerR regulator n=1 Tax=Metabacillus malikii TaxID=1504265 RepID=A0ABT9ZIX0_9BACI|nr:hypothetical protein [Metabacillus malikii]MDQ0231771.1 DNA-binding transcriptional MerR regulator [Metabacillus malikii]
MAQLKIGEFSKKVGKHSNTVANWFNQLHELKLHCVNRSPLTGEKVFDELDLEIALHIKALRDKKLSINEIFEDIGNQCKLRYFSIDDSLDEVKEHNSDYERLKMELLYIVQDVLSESLWDEFETIRKKLKALIDGLPSMMDERHNRIKDLLIIRRIEAELETEALHKWTTEPVSVRIKRGFFFKKEENIEARNQYVKGYIMKNLEERLLKVISFPDNRENPF